MFSRTPEEINAHIDRLKRDVHGATLKQLIEKLVNEHNGELELIHDGINSHGAEIIIGDVQIDILVKPRI